MRLIDADALKELIDGGFDLDFSEVPETKKALLEMIDYQDTVNAEPVVRCKDCRWYEKEPGGIYGYCNAAKHRHYSRNWEISIYRTYKDDFYCADGESGQA